MKVFWMLQLMTAAIGVMFLCSCGNTRLYIGVDDYGEPQEFHHDFKTRGNGDGNRTLGNPDKRY